MLVNEHELTRTAKSKRPARADFTLSYWRLLLDSSSRECRSIVTPDGIFTPTRVLHETTSVVLHLQTLFSTELPLELLEHVLCWVDDCLLHKEATVTLLRDPRLFFELCVKYNWKLNPSKCNLHMTEARWCRRNIFAGGICHDLSKLERPASLKSPTAGGQLQSFFCAML